MKKVSVIILLFMVVSKSYSQNQFYPGVKVGGSLVNWVGKDAGAADLRVSYFAGISGSFKLTKQFIVQPEILYSDLGPEFDGGKYHVSYINIPVIFKYQTLGGFYGETGPQLGYVLNAKYKNNGTNDVKEFVRSQDFSWAFGLGYKLRPGLEIGARQLIGFTKVDKLNNDIKNNAFSLVLGYTFGDR